LDILPLYYYTECCADGPKAKRSNAAAFTSISAPVTLFPFTAAASGLDSLAPSASEAAAAADELYQFPLPFPCPSSLPPSVTFSVPSIGPSGPSLSLSLSLSLSISGTFSTEIQYNGVRLMRPGRIIKILTAALNDISLGFYNAQDNYV
jgi:hypothetical protein